MLNEKAAIVPKLKDFFHFALAVGGHTSDLVSKLRNSTDLNSSSLDTMEFVMLEKVKEPSY